jgi:peptidoglycan/xylan/chitin deacetylase (PgdA/CDA1 family)
MNQPIPILNYHQIDRRPAAGTPLRGHTVTPDAFRRQMKLLKTLGYTGCSMTQLLPYLEGKKSGKVVGITFDDGYVNNLEHALPVLDQVGFTSTCYVVSGLIGETNRWDTPSGIPEKPLMNVLQLRRWMDAGQEIGAHGRTHLKLPQTRQDEAFQEIVQCRADLQDLLHIPVMHFCYPYGMWDPIHRDMVQDAGYTTATTMDRGRVRHGDDMFSLNRIPIWGRTLLPAFWYKLFSRYEDR